MFMCTAKKKKKKVTVGEWIGTFNKDWEIWGVGSKWKFWNQKR